MAILNRLVARDFRNIVLGEMEFSPNINCISGSNGSGKTSLIDAIWCLSMTKSSLVTSDRYVYRYGTEGFAVSGTYTMPNGLEEKFSLMSQNGEKKMKRGDKPYGKVSEHIGVLPIVLVSPSDSSMVSESGEERRKFANSVLSQIDREYLIALQQYNRLLLQRNKLLKDGIADISFLEIIDERMAVVADVIHASRKRFAEELSPVVAGYYATLSGGKENVSVEYKSDLQKSGLLDIFAENSEKDRIMKFTTGGIQRDDFIFSLDGHPIRRCGSQGQQKSFLVALKFAQYDLMKAGCGHPPMLLLDDVFDKLDMDRIRNLLSLVAGQTFGQIFITDSNKVRMRGIVDSITRDRAYFTAEKGHFTREDC